jgi:acetyl-CoA carboxylase carboxyl transferase beta subunit/acetyl-CoA carboxylase carboxyl transferase alpha subunit
MSGPVTVERRSWVRCGSCSTLLYRKRLYRNLEVCPECGDHRRLSATERIEQLVDPDSFTPFADQIAPADPLGFTDLVAYPARMAAARASTGLTEAVLCGEARIDGHRLVLVAMDFRFLGGSLGSVTGELIVRAVERARAGRLPFVVVTASGGARMQEGALSLMQMATTIQAIAGLRSAGLLSVSVITDPTYGGVAASFATGTDVIIAENGARMGFAGPRVIRQTLRQTLPAGFQTADFLLRHGHVDMVVERRQLRPMLRSLLASATPAGATGPAVAAQVGAGDPGPVVEPVGAVGPGPVAGTAPSRGAAPAPGEAFRVVRAARHIDRPTTLDYLATVFDGFVELHGDRFGADCPAIVAGLARLDGIRLAVIGHQKGHSTAELLARNFGMASPAGYRKAVRVMRMAAHLGLPVVTLIDTPGASPGIEAEEQGQAGAIAESIATMAGLPVPVVAVITGEGGSGGALALAVADRVLMLHDAVYSVISPEGCAAILWNDPAAAPRAADALCLTAPELLRIGVIDAIVDEPAGAGDERAGRAAAGLRRVLREALAPLLDSPGQDLVQRRRARFRRFCAAGEKVRTEPGSAHEHPGL